MVVLTSSIIGLVAPSCCGWPVLPKAAFWPRSRDAAFASVIIWRGSGAGSSMPASMAAFAEADIMATGVAGVAETVSPARGMEARGMEARGMAGIGPTKDGDGGIITPCWLAAGVALANAGIGPTNSAAGGAMTTWLTTGRAGIGPTNSGEGKGAEGCGATAITGIGPTNSADGGATTGMCCAAMSAITGIGPTNAADGGAATCCGVLTTIGIGPTKSGDAGRMTTGTVPAWGMA